VTAGRDKHGCGDDRAVQQTGRIGTSQSLSTFGGVVPAFTIVRLANESFYSVRS